jgi:hypothetical protein
VTINCPARAFGKSTRSHGAGFQTAVPGGDLADFGDRWNWIDNPMLPEYKKYESTGEMKQFMDELKEIGWVAE